MMVFHDSHLFTQFFLRVAARHFELVLFIAILHVEDVDVAFFALQLLLSYSWLWCGPVCSSLVVKRRLK